MAILSTVRSRVNTWWKQCEEDTWLDITDGKSMNSLTLWKTIISYEGQEFKTSGRGTNPGVAFSYAVSRQGGRGGRHYEGPEVPGYGNEIWISTADGKKKKSISRSTVEKAYNRVLELGGVVPGPKKLGVPGAASYLYPVFIKMEAIIRQEEPHRKENHTVPTLKDLRNKESLTIPQMAEIIGKSPSSWRNYENGGKTPDDVYEKLSAHFGISVEDLKAGTWEKVADIPSEEIDGADTPVEEKVTEPEEKPENSLEGFMNEPEEATEDVEPVESGQEAISGMTEYKPEPWVKLKEVAEYLGVDEATCREMAMKGEIPANKIGRGYRFKMSEVKAAVSSTTTTSSTKDTDVTVPTSAEHEDKADEVDKTDKKDVAEKSLSIIIQSVMGGTITVDEIEKRVKVAAPDADTVYVKPEENRAYWTGGGKMGYVVLWE